MHLDTASDWLWHEKYPEIQERVGLEYGSNQYPRQPWAIFPAARLKKIWRESAEGFIRDEKGLQHLADLVIENTLRLHINTELAGHSSSDPRDCAEAILDIANNDELEKFVDWCIETPEGGWRISDYGLDKLLRQAVAIRGAVDPFAILVEIDKALNIAHQRSDLASWFIEGGSHTLSELSA